MNLGQLRFGFHFLSYWGRMSFTLYRVGAHFVCASREIFVFHRITNKGLKFSKQMYVVSLCKSNHWSKCSDKVVVPEGVTLQTKVTWGPKPPMKALYCVHWRRIHFIRQTSPPGVTLLIMANIFI